MIKRDRESSKRKTRNSEERGREKTRREDGEIERR